MNRLKSGCINGCFFIAGDVAYSLFFFGREHDPCLFFGSVVVVLLFFILDKLDSLFSEQSNKEKQIRGKKHTNWMLSATLGAFFAFSSNGSMLLRWISTKLN
jgi:hypothetical protein